MFDLIFADPPYNMVDKERIVELVFLNGLLSEGGWFMLEHSKDEDFSKLSNYWSCKKYGEVNFSIFKR
jgi:16S rRNA G966 N2-methylase RsmD